MSVRFAIVGLMFATALALGLIAYQISGTPRSQNGAVPEPMTVSYLTAARALPPGTLLRAEDVTLKAVAAASLPPEALVDSPETRADIRNSLVRRYVEAGAPLTQADVMRSRERGYLAAVLAPGTRAVSIAVNAVTGVAGLIWPGDLVDVILTQTMDGKAGHGGNGIISETVLTNIRVLAVDQNIAQGQPANGAAPGRVGSTVTVQATADEAEKLAVATRLGSLSLAVRSAADVHDPALEAVAGPTVSGIDVSPALLRENTTGGSHVQVIQGDHRADVDFPGLPK